MVSLRLFKEEDILLKVKWINDNENNKFLHYDIPITVEKTRKWFQSIKNNKNRIDMVILYNDIPIGLIGLLDIDFKNKKAEYYIVIGEKKYKEKNLAYESSILLIQRAKKIGLTKLYLYTEIDNIPAQKLFEKVGFIQEGRLNKDLFYKNRYIDRFVYGYYLIK